MKSIATGLFVLAVLMQPVHAADATDYQEALTNALGAPVGHRGADIGTVDHIQENEKFFNEVREEKEVNETIKEIDEIAVEPKGAIIIAE